jgi:predicted NBD/HSP70 family sugar kinase
MLDLRDRLGAARGTKAINRKQVLLAVAVKADTQANLARRTGLAQSTVSSVVQGMQKEGVLTVGRGGQAAGSGRRTVVCLPPSRNVAVGVHLGFNHVTVVARRLDEPYDRRHTEYVDSGANRGLPEIMPLLRRAVEDAVAKTGRSLDDVLSLGMAVPGMIDPRKGEFTDPVISPWQRGDRPAGELAQWLSVPEALDNDANLGALAEQTYTTNGDAELVVYIKAATGIGAGLVLGNLPIRGHRGMAGEIGHLAMDPRGEFCYCGGRGCLETVIGADALLRQVRTSLSGRAADVPHSLPSLIQKARNGDAMCGRVLRDAGHTLGRAVASLCNLLNPDLIVIGGQLGGAGDLLLNPCRESLRQYALSGAVDGGMRLRTSTLGEYAEAQGALVLGLNALSRLDETQDAGE